MATPTPGGKHPAVVATPPVSTPFSASHNHPAFSPHGPRSMQPSPQQFKKSPANSNTLYGYPSGGGNHPTNSSFGVGYDSPSAAMALGGVNGLVELGLDGIGTPGASGLVGGVGLGGLGAGGRGDEEDRRRRLGLVMDILKADKGRLSEAGLERLARRVGLECLWEASMGSSGSTRTLIIAGSALALDIEFSNNVVKKVSLSFPESSETVTKHTDKAGVILLEDLQVKAGETSVTKKLDRFAANLERLAQLDKLSVIPGLNCYEAIAGIYESLERLHTWEVEKLKEAEEAATSSQELLDRNAICTRSGKPRMHTKGRVGLSLEYWQEKRRISNPINGAEVKTWSLIVECAALPMGIYPPIRISNNWISTDVQKAEPRVDEVLMAPDGEPVLDWQEPETTMLPSNEPPKPDAMEGVEQATNQKFPEVMFVAKFDPPVVVPYSLAMQIYNSTHAPIDMYQMSTFDGLMFPHPPGERYEESEARTIKQNVLVPVFDKDGATEKAHQNSLIIEKIDYGRILSELQFSHPSQLVGMLPALRQYAFLSTVLGKSFGSTARPAPEEAAKEVSKPPQKSKGKGFASFVTQASTSESRALSIDISLSTQPNPRLLVVFPFKKQTANITFDIMLNGVVEVISQNIIDESAVEEGDGKKPSVKDLGRMLEITEDLGIWVEFVRRRLG